MASSFAPLYKIKDNGKLYAWTIDVCIKTDSDTACIDISYGEHGGKQITHSKEVEEGKCKRTCVEQATQEATRKWLNKRDKELFCEWENLKNQTVEKHEAKADKTNVVVRPMLAQKADLDKGKKGRGYTIPFPLMVQRKYDGIRCIAYRNGDGNVVLESRKGTPFSGFHALTKELEQVFNLFPNTVYLDGELFTDRVDFETISGLVRKSESSSAKSVKTNKEGKNKKLTDKQQQAQHEDCENAVKKGWIDFHVYDMVDVSDLEQPFSRRCSRLQSIIDWPRLKKCKLVETLVVDTPDQIGPLHDRFVAEGFEGIMLRATDGPYQVNKRSKYLQKYKEFMDDEFRIVGFHEGSGNEKGAVVWDCVTKDGQPFAVRPRGTFDARKLLFQNAAAYIGKWLTVIFQEYSTDGIPRFPVGKGIRVGGI
jgi:ATP-dependent DNA ligase